MATAQNIEALSRLTPEQARAVGRNAANVLLGFKAAVIETGMREEELREALRSMAEAGDCSSGGMCAILT